MSAFRRDNQLIFILTNVLYGVGSSFIAEGYVQAYLMELGLGVSMIGLYGTLANATALAAYAAFNFYKPRGGNYMPMLLYSSFAQVLFPVLLIVSRLNPYLVYLPLPACALYQLALSFKSAGEFCVMPSLFPRSAYGKLSGRSGVIGGAIAAGISALSAVILGAREASAGYVALFSLSAVAFALSALAIKFYSVKSASGPAPEAKFNLRSALTRRNAWILLPHLLRGVGNAGFYYFVMISLERVALSASGKSLIVMVGVIGGMAGCFLFMRLERRFKTGAMTFIANIICGASAVLTAVNTSEPAFFVLYLVYTMAFNVSAYAIPSGVIYSIKSEELAFVSSMRLFVMSGAVCAFIPIFAKFMDFMPAWCVMAISAAIFSLAGFIFKLQYKDELKNSAA